MSGAPNDPAAEAIRPRRRGPLLIVAFSSLLIIAASPFLGPTTVDVRRALDGSIPTAENPDRQILLGARLPRTAAAVLVGSGLALSGAVLQAVLRNPLADPFTLGVSGGAALGAAAAIRFGLDNALPGGQGLSLAAIIGAAVAVGLVWMLARRGAVVLPGTLLLAGVTVSFISSAIILLLQHTAPLGQGVRILRWTMGSLDGLRTEFLIGTTPIWGVCVALMLTRARALNALAAGTDIAASVGVDVPRAVMITYVASSLLVGALVALAGPIGFVGLIVPHLGRSWVGADHRALLPMSVLGGAAFLVLCDVVARTVVSPVDLPVGALTALLGGPFFLWLLRRRTLMA